MQLDKAALDYAVRREQEGIFRSVIADELAVQGYKTKTGKALSASALSEFLIENNYRKNEERKFKKEEDKITLKDALAEVMSSNMSPDAKILIVRNIKI